MIKHLVKGVLSAIAVKLLVNYRHLSVRLLKIETAKTYLHGVRLARLSVIGLLRMGLMTSLVCVGVLLFHAGLFVLLPWSVKAKALFGMFLGVTYVAAGVLALRAALDEKTWMEKSGAAKLLEEVTHEHPLDLS
ncbi:MAG: hypothetical protein WCK89_00375 [bacterium]